MDVLYHARDWYWIIAGSTEQVFSSKEKGYVTVSDASYQAWLAQGNIPTLIDTEANLLDVLAEQAPECLPSTAVGNTARQNRLIEVLRNSEIGKVLMQVLLDHENRIRVLEGKQKVTMDQAIDALKAKL